MNCWLLKFNLQHKVTHWIKSQTSLNVFVIISCYVFYYRIGCNWMWVHIRRYCFLHCLMLHDSFQRVSVRFHWHLHGQSEGHQAVWSLKYFHGVVLEWSHLLECTNVWLCICVVVMNQNCARNQLGHPSWLFMCFKHLFVCMFFLCIFFLFSDAIQKLQAEVSRLQEKLESCLRNKKRPSSVRAATSTQEKHPLHRTSTPHARFFIFSV